MLARGFFQDSRTSRSGARGIPAAQAFFYFLVYLSKDIKKILSRAAFLQFLDTFQKTPRKPTGRAVKPTSRSGAAQNLFDVLTEVNEEIEKRLGSPQAEQSSPHSKHKQASHLTGHKSCFI
jgi:hypothetical protein